MYQIMIIDDDLIIRRGLSQAIPWAEYGYQIAGVAGDGQTALQMMAEAVPDIVICDIRMPRVDGLEFTKSVRSQYPEVKIILLTAYKDFEYAKTALKLQAFDYLLKPVDNQLLIEVVDRAALALAEQQRIRRKLEESRPLLLQQFLVGLIEERYGPEEIRSKIELLEIGAWDGPLVVAVIKVDDYYLRNERAAEKEGWKAGIGELVNRMTEKERQGLLFESGQDEAVLILAVTDDLQGQLPAEVYYLAERIRRAVRETLGITVTIGTGKVCEGLAGAGRSYAEACSALELRHILGQDQTLTVQDPPRPAGRATVDIYPAARELLRPIKLGLLDESLAHLARMERQIMAEPLPLDHLQLIGMEIMMLLFTEVKEWPEIGEKIGRQYNFYQFHLEIKQLQSAGAIFAKLREVVRDLCNAVNTIRKKLQQTLVEQAMEYIVANYAKDGLSLQDVASQIHVSPTYLSNIFKKARGINFSDFVLEVRMKKAMELLRNSNLKAYEVAERIGYANVHYFSAIFKKYTGVSPTEFKNG